MLNICILSSQDCVSTSRMQNSASVNFGFMKYLFLIHVLSSGGIMVDPTKVQELLDWKAPISVHKV
jgi:hypothetical protein